MKITNSTEQSPPWESPHLFKKFLAFYGAWSFNTAFTTPGIWTRSIESMPPHPNSWRTILLLSSHLRLAIFNWFLFLGSLYHNPMHNSPVCSNTTGPGLLKVRSYINYKQCLRQCSLNHILIWKIGWILPILWIFVFKQESPMIFLLGLSY
jgi:hypothetical protein